MERDSSLIDDLACPDVCMCVCECVCVRACVHSCVFYHKHETVTQLNPIKAYIAGRRACMLYPHLRGGAFTLTCPIVFINI